MRLARYRWQGGEEGDEVVAWIERIGELRNRIVREEALRGQPGTISTPLGSAVPPSTGE
ncbi:hypothetical protein HRbin10_00884 [bacterium HR10]|uniref:Uncharacterized protein n=1 Tax=uncultured Acidobacteriota bacterium TaxID=171953 RepID=H5SCH5_9BACT|nr:hypothetical protein HGMM_F10C03C29 [uncultured Acidobacteriota bacterium]GBC81772.1 hypothetical protein HRbin10_00884 [bacterium HR10]